METVEVLKHARQLIVDRGWVQGSFWGYDDHGGTGGFCALGAVREVTGWGEDKIPAEGALEYALPSSWYGVITYNDYYKTTKEDILALFDRAIEAES